MKAPSEVVNTGRSAELERLLTELREEPVPERDAARQARLEARMLAHLDEALATPLEPRRLPARRFLGRGAAALLLAASVALGIWAHDALRPPQTTITAERLGTPRAARRDRSYPAPALGSARVPVPQPSAPPMNRPRSEPRLQAAASSAETPIAASSAAGPAPVSTLPSTLSAENRLFEAAASAERRGDLGEAVANFDRLLATYPQSPLGQQAMVRKFRALERSGQAQAAAQAAQAYLDSFPQGFAVAEARAAIAAGKAPIDETP